MSAGAHGSRLEEPAAWPRRARQMLRTGLLMGVEFVPLRRISVAGAEHPEPEAARPSAPEVPASGPPQVGRTPPVSATPPIAAATSPPLAAVESVLVEAKPAAIDPRRHEAQRRLDELRARYEKDAPHAKFVTDHHCIVFGDGDPCARLMIIGEAPGAEEDRVGIPFVGRAGQLLDKMLGAMGLPRKSVYITNVLKTRPPNNATPTADEAAACAPYLFEQIRIVSPEVILALGLPATRVLLNSTDSMSRLRGRWWMYADPRTIGYEVPVMPTYHPAFLLRSYTRENREKVWSDLQMVMAKLGLAAAAG